MAEVDDWAPVKQADDWAPVGQPEPASQSPSFMSGIMDRVKEGFTQGPNSTRNKMRAGVESQLRTGLSNYPGDVKDVFMEGVHQTSDAFLGNGKSQFDDLRDNVENQLIAVGRTPEQAKGETDRLMEGWKRQERSAGAIFGPLTAITAPFFGGPMRSFISRPIEEQTEFPKEATEGFINVGAAALGMRSLARVTIGKDGKVTAHAIGDAPKPEDFKTAADLVARSVRPEPERVTAAAITLNDGKVFTASTHGEAFNKATDELGISGNELLKLLKSDSQFVTSEGRIVSRGDAGKIASENKQFRDRRSGGYTKAEDINFEPSRSDDTAANTEANLRTMWDERGIHPAEALNDAKNDTWARNELTQPIDAYHGSPHDFESFDLSKIGSGEGAQSYGHGLYFAENREVGEAYKGQFFGGKAFNPNNPAHKAAALVDELGSREKAIAEARRRFERDPDPDHFNKDVLSTLESGRELPKANANLYTVRIRADREHLLDWDKPLSEQPQTVKDLFKDHQSDISGADLHEALVQRVLKQQFGDGPWSKKQQADAEKGASKLLFDAGVPGIKYLDQASRSGDVGTGTSNFVIFDDKLIDITHKNGEALTPKERAAAVEEMQPRPGGADVPHDPPYVSPAVEPPPPPGSLLADVRNINDQIVGLGRNLQYVLDPMATGSPRAMVIAKDAISSVRRIRWEHARRDAQIVKEFSPESWERMWNAMDEESVLRQEGKTSEHMGLETLEPKERLMVDILHEESQMAWLHAVDAGLVEGEGLPAYTPRMVLNVAAVSDQIPPQALNELGRNVFTRTAQMKHRKNLLAEETEAAAKEMVAAQMKVAGKSPEEIKAALEKVQIARNVRAMPLATAKLQEATIWRNMIKGVEDAGKATGSDTVADFNPGKGWFTIAGNPAFTKWAPKLIKEDGKWRAMGDDQGNTIFEAKPIYMRDEFRGPMMSILEEPPGKVAELASTPYEALMGLKSRSMNLILNSPLIHNAVVWSKVAEASGGREWLGFNLYRKGRIMVESNPARTSQLIERGLNPMGPRGSIQDITAIMESPDIMSGHNVSFTGKIAAFVPGLFDPGAGAAVERGIAKAGNYWHNTLLWDKVRNVHFGLADHLSDRLVAEGADRVTADRVATHFSNIIVGSIPKEAMSAGARATANMMLFSRSFTLGNLSTFKQAAFGLPKPIMAQIARDATAKLMFERDPKTGEFVLPSEEREAIVQAQIDKSQAFAKSAARSKAMWTVGLSAAMFYIGNAVITNGFNMALRDETMDDQLKGYARRYKELLEDVKNDPLELRHMLERLSPTYDNEPNKQDRIHFGYDKDGTPIYVRNPTGKFGEELIGYPTHPMRMVRSKLSPTLSGILDILENDKGFGHKIYDENDKSAAGDVATAIAVAKHIVMKHLPEQQINAAVDLLGGDGDTRVNAMRLLGPLAGFSASVGSPKGMAGGEAFAVRQELNARFDLNWPMIKRQIQRGDVEGAQQAMEALRIPPMMQRGLLRSAMNPGSPLRGRTLREFYQSATPAQIERFERAPRAPQPADGQ